MIGKIHQLPLGTHLIVSAVIGVLFTLISYLIAVGVGWEVQLSRLEAAAVATSYACTYLATVETRYNYPLGVITTLLYSILLYRAGLPAVALFNLYLVFSLIYGWFRWGKDGTLRVTDFRWRSFWPLLYVTVAAGVFVILIAVSLYFNASMARMDIAVAVLSGMAQVMLDNKHRQTWAVWAVVNVLSIWLYIQGGLYLVTVQYAFFLLNTVFGHMMWTTSMRRNHA